jgi:tetratricopeptide (TPR) repeat protein
MLMTPVAKLTKNSALGISYYERAIKMFPRYAITYAQYGKYLTDFDQADAGIEKLMTAIEMDPKLAAAYVWIAGAYFKKGNKDLARESAEKARSLGYNGNLSQFGL